MWIKSPKELAQLVREQRKRKGLSQQKLSELTGVSRQWIIALEQGKPTAELGLVLQALSAIGLRVDIRDRSDAGDNDIAAVSEATTLVLERARTGDAPPRRLRAQPLRRP
ncbi:MAG: helix-turn-helix domain-containing protein [Longimicrobiaceae bacterium]